MNTYIVHVAKVAGSGFLIYLVKTDSEGEAKNIITEKTGNHLGLSVQKIEIYNDKNKNLVEIINYDDPTYEG